LTVDGDESNPSTCGGFCAQLNTFRYRDCQVFDALPDNAGFRCRATADRYLCSEQWATRIAGSTPLMESLVPVPTVPLPPDEMPAWEWVMTCAVSDVRGAGASDVASGMTHSHAGISSGGSGTVGTGTSDSISGVLPAILVAHCSEQR
jgi:hypothetical protein